ncbi:MAG: glutamyl-tRNA amidotransferase [SAR86 cluster bacterium]|uniref:Glutamyl-tRNA amidotransferase n=1 Tax=SAR86 cluster bacterium TaxID=2030880 RepID=A0A2A4XBW8_9GAMM|nr:MAG: glutamyl-tRNA amidotransferase [SAR86 cluster bacterium]
MICIRRLLFVLSLLSPFPVVAQSNFDVFEASISEIQKALGQGQINSVQLTQQYLDRIQAYDKQGPKLNSIVRINPEALAQAQALDAERELTGSRGPLHGVPIVIKDNYNTDHMPTTGGSVALASFIPSENAAQVDKLLQAGAIILAKTNLHEYAYGITSIGSLVGQTRNPYDPRRVPGGSSGGTGAAAAASFAAAAFGSDTCGSIRIPSAFNNLIGLRPSKGLSSIYGILPLSHTQDVAGPLARSAEDLAIILDIVSGYDYRDEATEIMRTTAAPAFVDRLYSANLGNLRIGKLQQYFEGSDGAVSSAIEDALDWYEQQGAEIVDVEIADMADLVRRSGLIGHEFKTDINQYLATFSMDESLNLNFIVSQGLYHEAVDGVLSRSNASEFDEQAYRSAMAVRSQLRAAIETVMAEQNLDAIAYPTIKRTQVFTGDSQPGSNCSLSANSGLPALSMPVGFTSNGLPVGLELLGGFLQDAELLAIAQPYESTMSSRRAPSTTPALESGLAPAPQRFELLFSRALLRVEASFEFDAVTNLFEFQVNKEQTQGQAITAVTLVVDSDGDGNLTEPVVLNLLPPDVIAATGSHFMSAEFREAVEQGRLYLKVFGDSLPSAGAVQLLE